MAGSETPRVAYGLPVCASFIRANFYGAGTLITVLTMVTDALRANALPLSVVIAALPAVENVTPAEAMMVPTMVPPPAGFIVAALPTCQNTFLAWAPLISITLRGAPGAPTVSVLAIWNTHTALASPCPSKTKSVPVIKNEPAAALYSPGGSVSPPSWPAPGSAPPGREAGERLMNAALASAKACVAIAAVAAVPSFGQPTVGGGGAVSIFPFTNPMLLPVSV